MNEQAKILLYGSNLWYFGEGMFGPLFAVFAQRVGGNILQLTVAWAVYLIVMGVIMIIIGKVSDRRDAAKLLIAGCALNALFTFGYLFVSSPTQLFIVQAGLGAAYAFASPTWLSLYGKAEDKGREGLEWGLVTGEGKILTGLAIILGGLIVTYFSFTVLFLVMGTIQVIATLYQSKILRFNVAANHN